MSDDLDDEFSSFGQPAVPVPAPTTTAGGGSLSDDSDDEFAEFGVPAKVTTAGTKALDDDDDDDDDEFAEVRSLPRTLLPFF